MHRMGYGVLFPHMWRKVSVEKVNCKCKQEFHYTSTYVRMHKKFKPIFAILQKYSPRENPAILYISIDAV